MKDLNANRALHLAIHAKTALGRSRGDLWVSESYANLRATQRRDDGKTISLMTADLRLAKPLSTEFYRHLTGRLDPWPTKGPMICAQVGT